MEGLVAGANKSQQEFDKVEAGRVVVSGWNGAARLIARAAAGAVR